MNEHSICFILYPLKSNNVAKRTRKSHHLLSHFTATLRTSFAWALIQNKLFPHEGQCHNLEQLCQPCQPWGWPPSATKTSSASPRQNNSSLLVSRSFPSALCPSLSAWCVWCWSRWLQLAPPRARRELRCVEGSSFVWPCPPAAVLAWEGASRTLDRISTPITVSNSHPGHSQLT